MNLPLPDAARVALGSSRTPTTGSSRACMIGRRRTRAAARVTPPLTRGARHSSPDLARSIGGASGTRLGLGSPRKVNFALSSAAREPSAASASRPSTSTITI